MFLLTNLYFLQLLRAQQRFLNRPNAVEVRKASVKLSHWKNCAVMFTISTSADAGTHGPPWGSGDVGAGVTSLTALEETVSAQMKHAHTHMLVEILSSFFFKNHTM